MNDGRDNAFTPCTVCGYKINGTSSDDDHDERICVLKVACATKDAAIQMLRAAIGKWDGAPESAGGGWADNPEGEAVYDALSGAFVDAYHALSPENQSIGWKSPEEVADLVGKRAEALEHQLQVLEDAVKRGVVANHAAQQATEQVIDVLREALEFYGDGEPMTCYEIWTSHDKTEFRLSAAATVEEYPIKSTDGRSMVCLASFTVPSWRQAHQLYEQLMQENTA